MSYNSLIFFAFSPEFKTILQIIKVLIPPSSRKIPVKNVEMLLTLNLTSWGSRLRILAKGMMPKNCAKCRSENSTVYMSFHLSHKTPTWPEGSVKCIQLLELYSSTGTSPSHCQDSPMFLAPLLQMPQDAIRCHRHGLALWLVLIRIQSKPCLKLLFTAKSVLAKPHNYSHQAPLERTSSQ